MTEKFTLQQTAGNGSAVEFDQRSLPPAAAIVNGACNELFARACLSHQQHVRISCSHRFDQLQHLPQSCTLTDDFFKLALTADLFFQTGLAFHIARQLTGECICGSSAPPPVPATDIRCSSYAADVFYPPRRAYWTIFANTGSARSDSTHRRAASARGRSRMPAQAEILGTA